ncbi:MAG: C4-dicarboxylate TRAP transporter substrate-binding protein [Neomegalonema sp.]|nr:C4-dicarboxylate TRAP transporter substrate-binding protein [Neomegalonema sp.]
MKRTIAAAFCGLAAFGFVAEAAAKTTWNVSLWGKRRAFTEHVEKLAELVAERSGGEFELKISYGGLSKNRENLDGISIGAFEMAQFCAAYHPDKNPTLMVLDLPFLGVGSLAQERKVSMAYYKHPAVVKDLARWSATLLMPSPLPQYNLAGAGEAPKSLADLKGMPIRATGGIGRAMKAIGGVPTSMTASEVRPSLDSGVIKAAAFAPHAHMSFGVVEVAKWWTTNLNPGTLNCPVVVNTDALKGLSEKNRKILLGAVDEALDHYLSFYNGKTMTRWGPLLAEKGIATVTFSEDEIAKLKKDVAGPAAEEWVKANAAKGLPAKELYDFALKLIAEHK